MRLFIAINFNDETKQKLIDIENRLKEKSIYGNFTTYENLHLTLVFLGEVDASKIGLLHNIMNLVTVSPFSLYFKGVGRFQCDGGNILWAGIEANKNLTGIYDQLSGQISSAGFQVEKRKFAPHLTLGRQVKLRDDFDLVQFSNGINPIYTEVAKISLMKSERIKGKLTYTEI